MARIQPSVHAKVPNGVLSVSARAQLRESIIFNGYGLARAASICIAKARVMGLYTQV